MYRYTNTPAHTCIHIHTCTHKENKDHSKITHKVREKVIIVVSILPTLTVYWVLLRATIQYYCFIWAHLTLNLIEQGPNNKLHTWVLARKNWLGNTTGLLPVRLTVYYLGISGQNRSMFLEYLYKDKTLEPSAKIFHQYWHLQSGTCPMKSYFGQKIVKQSSAFVLNKVSIILLYSFSSDKKHIFKLI